MMRPTMDSLTSSGANGSQQQRRSSSVFGEVPAIHELNKPGRGSYDPAPAVRFSKFWYWFRWSLPLSAPVSFAIFFLIPSLFFNNTEDFIFFGACLSILFCSLAVLSYFHIPHWRRHPSSLMVQICLMSVVVSLLCLTQASPNSALNGEDEVEIITTRRVRDTAKDRLPPCMLMSFFLQLTMLAREMWIFTLSLDLITSITNPFASYQQNLRKYHATIWLVGTAVAALLVGERECQGEFLSNGTCWLRIDDVLSTCFWGYFMSWVIVFYVIALLVLLYAYARIRKGLESTFAVRVRFVADTIRVVFFYFFYGVCLVALFLVLYFFAEHALSERAGRYVRHWFAFGIAARGFFDALVWFFSHGFAAPRSLASETESVVWRSVWPWTTPCDCVRFCCGGGEDGVRHTARESVFFAEQDEDEEEEDELCVTIDQLTDRERDTEGEAERAAAMMQSMPQQTRNTHNDAEEPLLSQSLSPAARSPTRVVSFHARENASQKTQKSENTLLRQRGLRGRARTTSGHTHALTAQTTSEHDVSPQLNLALRDEVLQLVTQGITESVARNIDRERRRQRRAPPAKDPTESNFAGSSHLKRERGSDVSLALSSVENDLERVRLSDASDRAAPLRATFAAPRDTQHGARSLLDILPSSLRYTFYGGNNAYGAPPGIESPSLHDPQWGERDVEENKDSDRDEDEDGDEDEGFAEGERVLADAFHGLLAAVGAVRPGEFGVDDLDSKLEHNTLHAVPASTTQSMRASVSALNARMSVVQDDRATAMPHNALDPLKRLWAEHSENPRGVPPPPSHTQSSPPLWRSKSLLETSDQYSDSQYSDSDSLTHSLSHLTTPRESTLHHSEHCRGHTRRSGRKRRRRAPPAEVVFLLNNTHAFRDFRPATFHKLRALSELSEEQYLSLIVQPAHEKLSEGKSGAFFFLCGEGEIVVKTVERHEATTLLSILDRYFAHLLLNPQSLLVRFLGLHSIKLYGNEFYFVVMKNVFPAGLVLNERFDIKGSWIQRNASLATPGKLSTCRYCGESFVEGNNESVCTEVVGSHEASVTLKDNDLITKIRLYPDDAFQVIETLFSDSDALCEMGVMDYSLLVGVRFARYDVDALHRMHTPVNNEHFFPAATPAAHDLSAVPTVGGGISPISPIPSQQQVGGGGGEHGGPRAIAAGFPTRVVIAPREYHFGVIDMLQTWSWSKKLERLFKVYLLGQPSEGISCMNPKDFKDRYQRKIMRIIEHSNMVREVTGSWQGKREVGSAFPLVDHHNSQ